MGSAAPDASPSSRARDPEFRRVVVLGHTGSITFDALRWLADVGIRFIQLDPDGRLLAASAEFGRDDPRLRRAQALAIDTPTGDDVARRLIAEKVAGQAQTLARLDRLVPVADRAVDALRGAAGKIHTATSRDELRLAEAQAAAAYWSAWAPLTLRYPTRDADRIPAAWRTFGSRSSDVTGNPRLATNPANAILNYLYAVLEAEARLACLAIGLDPGLGVLHADLTARDSLALDAMEPARPLVDRYVLDLVGAQVFRARDFHETRQGVCRVLDPLSHRIAETGPQWAGPLGRIVESVARSFAGGPDSRVTRVPTTLTGSNRSASRPGSSRTLEHRHPAARLETAPEPRCKRCGEPVRTAQRRVCDDCLPAAVQAQRNSFTASGVSRLADLRAQGVKPGIGGEAARARGMRVSDSRRRNDTWARTHASEARPEDFERDVRPWLTGVNARELALATGFSRPYCSAILRGARVPHPASWDAIRSLVDRRSVATGASQSPPKPRGPSTR